MERDDIDLRMFSVDMAAHINPPSVIRLLADAAEIYKYVKGESATIHSIKDTAHAKT